MARRLASAGTPPGYVRSPGCRRGNYVRVYPGVYLRVRVTVFNRDTQSQHVCACDFFVWTRTAGLPRSRRGRGPDARVRHRHEQRRPTSMATCTSTWARCPGRSTSCTTRTTTCAESTSTARGVWLVPVPARDQASRFAIHAVWAAVHARVIPQSNIWNACDISGSTNRSTSTPAADGPGREEQGVVEQMVAGADAHEARRQTRAGRRTPARSRAPAARRSCGRAGSSRRRAPRTRGSGCRSRHSDAHRAGSACRRSRRCRR